MSFTPAYQSYTVNLLANLKDYFNLQDYALDVTFMKEGRKFGAYDTIASINTDPRYFQIHINIYPLLYKKYQDKKYFEHMTSLVHELCHTLYQPIYDRFATYISDAEDDAVTHLFEQQVQRTANIISKAIPESFYIPTTPTKPPTKNAKPTPRNKRSR
jgi:hypothetical protein